MSRFVAKTIYGWQDDKGNTIVSFVVSSENAQAALMTIHELKPKDLIEIIAKENKESRTQKQNKLFWALVSKISDVINGSHTKEDTDKLYADILVMANVKRDVIALLPEAIEGIRPHFRAVIPTGQKHITFNELTKKSNTIVSCWVYHGSSTFNTKEMHDLIEITMDYAASLGIQDSELKSMEDEYLRGYHNEKQENQSY